MPTDTSQIVNKAWNYAHVLRDDGLSYMAYTKQITFLTFLLMACGLRLQFGDVGWQDVRPPVHRRSARRQRALVGLRLDRTAGSKKHDLAKERAGS